MHVRLARLVLYSAFFELTFFHRLEAAAIVAVQVPSDRRQGYVPAFSIGSRQLSKVCRFYLRRMQLHCMEGVISHSTASRRLACTTKTLQSALIHAALTLARDSR